MLIREDKAKATTKAMTIRGITHGTSQILRNETEPLSQNKNFVNYFHS